MKYSRCSHSLLRNALPMLLPLINWAFAELHGITRHLQTASLSGQGPCGPEEGSFVIEAQYQGAPGTFNIATTALGKDEDADEVYHLTSLAEDLSSGITYQGCFESNTLYRFVVYVDRPGIFVPAPDGEFKFTVNGRLIVSGTTQSIFTTFAEYYFSGDSNGCDGDFFSLIVQFDGWPSEIEWTLENQNDATEPPLTEEATLKEGAMRYTSEFENAVLFVDKCLVSGDEYEFTITDSAGDGLMFPNYYEIASNGVVIRSRTGDFGFDDSVMFLSDGSPPPVAPNPPNSFLPTARPVSAPLSVDDPTLKPASSKTPVSFPEEPNHFSTCFSASTTVQVKDRGNTEMRFLQIGDEIAVGAPNVYEPVYSFGHYDPSGQADFLRIETEHSKLEVSHQHLIFVEKNGAPKAVPAASILVGDRLILGDNAGSMLVGSIEQIVVRDGLYAPFTPSGKILVNEGLLVSSFVGFDATVGGGGAEVSYHWLAHTFEFPHRIACYYLGSCPGETYNDDGLSTWVAWPMQSALWLVNLESIALKGILFGFFLSVMLSFKIVEMVVFHHGVLTLLGLMMLGKVTGGGNLIEKKTQTMLAFVRKGKFPSRD